MSAPRIASAIDVWNRHLPGVKPYYAVKCNPAPQLLQHLCSAGIAFDCASRRELLDVQKLARAETAERIIYANPCKSQRDIETAKEMGAPTTVVDSVEEVEKLADYSGGALIRIAVDDSGSSMPFSSKFGAKEVLRIAEAAKAMNLTIRGISFHVGSASKDSEAHANAIRTAHKHLVKLEAAGHAGADTIDIGGGYSANKDTFWYTASFIRQAMYDIEDRPIRWIAEPGRFMAANAFDFYVQVIAKKRTSAGWSYTIDDSLYGQFSCILFDHAEPVWKRISDGTARPLSPGVLFGRTCDSVDVIARSAEMEELVVGDWLWFPRMGAYTRATASEFNGFPMPEIFVENDSVSLPVEDKGVTRMPAVSAKAFWA
jgi:ornithine decarboxylase